MAGSLAKAPGEAHMIAGRHDHVTPGAMIAVHRVTEPASDP
jgi:hypothetical protein